MKIATLILALISSLNGMGQTRKPIDWKPCQDVTDKFKKEVDRFNAEHKDGFQIILSCTYSGDPSRRQKPIKTVALTPSEIRGLHELRKIEDAGFATESAYENYLFHAHGIRKPDVGEPCYYFVGIIVDTDYITVDPNPVLPEC